jgi:dynein heavy chain
VTDFKAASQRIDAVCRSIAELGLVSVEKKRIYQHTEFQEMQAAHHAIVREKLVAAADEIREVMASVYKVTA